MLSKTRVFCDASLCQSCCLVYLSVRLSHPVNFSCFDEDIACIISGTSGYFLACLTLFSIPLIIHYHPTPDCLVESCLLKPNRLPIYTAQHLLDLVGLTLCSYCSGRRNMLTTPMTDGPCTPRRACTESSFVHTYIHIFRSVQYMIMPGGNHDITNGRTVTQKRYKDTKANFYMPVRALTVAIPLIFAVPLAHSQVPHAGNGDKKWMLAIHHLQQLFYILQRKLFHLL